MTANTMKTIEKEEITNNNTIIETENIDKIRDILFGVQVRDFEKRFSKLEKYFEKALADFQRKTEKRFLDLQTTIEKEIGSVVERIHNEGDTRSQDIKGVSDDLKIASDNFSAEITNVVKESTKSAAAITQQLEKRGRKIESLLDKKHGEALDSLRKESDSVRAAGVDRKSLANAFSQLAHLLDSDTKEKI